TALNGPTMTEHTELQRGVLMREWGCDGAIVSDWLAARHTVGAALGGLDIAMPGWRAVFGDQLAAAVRAGQVPEAVVDEMVRRVLRLAARAGILEGAPPAVDRSDLPGEVDGRALAREIASRSFVLLRNDGVLPLQPEALRR